MDEFYCNLCIKFYNTLNSLRVHKSRVHKHENVCIIKGELVATVINLEKCNQRQPNVSQASAKRQPKEAKRQPKI